MATWFGIPDTAVDPDAPLTSQLGYAWRDNPIAIAEGASGAPRVMPLAIGSYLGRVELDATTTPVVVSGCDPDTIIQVVGSFANGTADTATLQISGSTDGGSTWGSWVNLGASPGASNTRYGASIIVNLKNGLIDSAFSSAGDLGAGPFDAVRFRHSVTLSGSGNEPARLSVFGIGRAP